MRSLLATSGAYVLIAGGVVYSWVGSSARADVRKNAMQLALSFAKRNSLPESTPVKVIKEGTEPPLFKQAFSEWTKPALPSTPLAPRSFSGAPGSTPPPPRAKATPDVASLVRRSKEAGAEDKPVDDGKGDLTVWRIENFERAPWPRDEYGHFYAGDSYVVLYKYKDASKRDAAFIYFWQGRDSSQDEKAAAALQAKALDDEMGGWPVQVRVVQGKEPNHFFMIFQGKMVVHHGGKASGFKNAADKTDVVAGAEPALYHVRGTSAYNTRAVQTALQAASLNSGDCFIAVVPGQSAYLWEGKFSSHEERSFAASVMLQVRS